MVSKDEEVEKDREKFSESKANMIKKIKSLEKKLANVESQNVNIHEEFEMFRKEQESSPVQLIKNELNSKNYEILEL